MVIIIGDDRWPVRESRKMEISEIRIKLMESSEDRLRAFCSITIDGAFVVRDLKIIDGTNGPFVAMPSRKLSGHCQRCNHKNHLRASYCNHCGVKLQSDSGHDYESPQKLYADVAHPINSECRELIQNAVIKEFKAELNRSNEPGYRSRYDDDFDLPETGPAKEVLIDKGKPTNSRDSVPRPKFKDPKTGDPKRKDKANQAASGSVSASETSGEDQSDDDDQSGFGAGIF